MQREENIDMNAYGAYNLVVPKTLIIMEENPAYGRIRH